MELEKFQDGSRSLLLGLLEDLTSQFILPTGVVLRRRGTLLAGRVDGNFVRTYLVDSARVIF